MKGLLPLVSISVGVAFIAAACGGGGDPTPTATPAITPTPAVGNTPTPAQDAPTASRYSWEVSIVDSNGAKPSLAVDSQGTPHIAYMLEARPGFVKHAVLESRYYQYYQ